MKLQIIKYLNLKGEVVEMRKDHFRGNLPENIIKEYEVEIKDEGSVETSQWEVLKRKYKSGNYILLTPTCFNVWTVVQKPLWDCDNYKLIHNNHKDILEVYLKNPSVRIEKGLFTSMVDETEPIKWVDLEKDFIEDYNEEFWYRLKMKVLAWYEDESMIGKMIYDGLNMEYGLVRNIKYNTIETNLGRKYSFSEISFYKLRPATESEVLGLVYEPQPKENKFEKSLKIMEKVLQKTSTEEIDKTIQEENTKQEEVKQEGEEELQTITLNGEEYYLVPKGPLLTINDLRDIGLSEKDLLENGCTEEDLRKESREKYLQRKFEEGKGKYGVLLKKKCSNNWSLCYATNILIWRKDRDYKLFRKEHKDIIEAFFNDTTLKIEYRWLEEDWRPLDNFIENYDEDMQIRIIKKKFEPFVLNIEINTLDEAKSLWNRFNLNYNILCRVLCNSYDVEFENRISTHKYWNQIDAILKDFGEDNKNKKDKK